MSRRFFIGTFQRDEDILGATDAARARGYRVADVYTPYPVHGLDRAMGLAPSRLGRACLAFGLLGTALAFGFQYWASAVDWPINVGGRPWNSWPAFLPVAFELMVLLAGLGVVFTFFFVARLFPGKAARMPADGVTDDRFVLVLEESDAAFDAAATRLLFSEFGATDVEEREEEMPPAPAWDGRRTRRLNYVLLFALLACVGLNWAAGTDPSRRNLEVLPGMVDSVPYDAFAANPWLPGGQTLQPPEPGTIPRGQMPLHYRATPEDALRAGRELCNPFAADDPRARERGAQVYANYCQVCHGPQGRGDGPVTTRGVPPPPSLLAEKALHMQDGQMFHILTYGQGNMAAYAGQISREDRWRAVLHVRALQKQGEGRKQP